MSKVLEDPEGDLKSQLLDWIAAVTTEKVNKSEPFEKVLKDGILLCKLLNKIVPGSIKRINTKGSNFNWMENMAAVQKSMRLYGVPEDELFQPIDLVEARNVRAVVMSLSALARLCFNKGFDGPSFGPKMAETAMP